MINKTRVSRSKITTSADEMIDMMLREQQLIMMQHDDHVANVSATHDVRRVRVTTSQQDTRRMITVDDECTVDLDSVHTRKILKSHKIARIESDRQRDVRAREQAFRDAVSKINF